ncbi:MAG: SusC/RagA family TonB-linked outer membrane protein [Bacteroidota bacterium]
MHVNRLANLRAILLLGFVVSCLTGFAQRTLTGTVTDQATGAPLIRATIFVKGTTIGTFTNLDGSFSLEAPAEADTLQIRYIGYETQELPIRGTSDFSAALTSVDLLDEVIIVGYGTIKREDATGSLQSVNTELFNKGAITGPQELLAGKVPGVTITTDGSPGGGAAIRIRGESSLSASNDPLIVIDGVPIDNSEISGSRNPLNIINPNDIESFTVLKDASASAIYGNRASGGVILITTKKGTLGKGVRIGYNGNASVGTPINTVDVLGADEYRDVIMRQYDETHPARTLLGSANTDWQEEIYQTAVGHDHNVYASGGIGSVPYRVSLGYTYKEGILKTDEFQRITTGINLNPKLLKNTLQVNMQFKAMFTQNQFADRGAIGNALGFDPTQPVRDSSSPYGGFTTWTIANGNPNAISPANPVALLELRDDQSDVNRFLFNVALDYRIPFLPDLRANLNLARDYSKGEGTVNVPNIAAFAFDEINGGGVRNEYSQEKTNDLLEVYLNYKKIIDDDHDIDLLAGYSWQHFEIDNSFRDSDVAGTPSETVAGADPAEYFLLSTYGRLNYSFKQKYYLTLTVRRDGTSRFAEENRWGTFPAAALAVKLLDNENKTFNNLKLRAGWGITGQQEIGDFYAYLARYQVGFENARYQFGNEFVTTLRPNGYDANIRWEETETYNFGLDFSIIKDRLSGSVDLYQRNTTDLLNRIPVPAGTNLSNFVTTNVGDMENRGIEVSLFTTPVKTENISVDLAFNVAYNENEITKLTAVDDPNYEGVLTGSIAGGVGSNIQIHSVGFAPRSFYVFKQLYDDAGNLLEDEFEDLNGDGIINDQDKYRFQKPAADYTYGFSGNVKIYNFDLTFAGRGNIGNYVYNNVQTDMGYLNRLYGTTGVLWNVNRSAVDLNVLEQASLTFSDHFVKRADFFRFDHITVGYTFNNIAKVAKFARIYATLQNPFVITEYDGLDPEIFGGIDNNIYPKPRTWLLGLSVEF